MLPVNLHTTKLTYGCLRCLSSTPVLKTAGTNGRKIDPSKLDEIESLPQKPKKPPTTHLPPSPISWKSAGLATAVGAVVSTILYINAQRRKELSEKNKNRTIGSAAIYSDFDLVDTENKRRTSEEFRGRWILVYFGFTHCPDVCPEELEKLALAIEKLHKQKVDIVPIFITVDPGRDKPELIKRYLAEFSDKFIGLTGSDEQIAKATRSFRVYFSPGPKDKDEDYIVDHTIISYLMGPDGRLVDYFGQTRTAEEIANTCLLRVKASSE